MTGQEVPSDRIRWSSALSSALHNEGLCEVLPMGEKAAGGDYH